MYAKRFKNIMRPKSLLGYLIKGKKLGLGCLVWLRAPQGQGKFVVHQVMLICYCPSTIHQYLGPT